MSSRSPNSPSIAQWGGEPRVNLLPPEVAQRSKVKATRRALIAVVIGAVVVVAAGYVGAYLYAADTQSKLVAAQARTADLLAQKAKLSDATAVANLLKTTTQAREVGASYEVIWASVLDKLTALLPPGGSYFSLDGVQRLPWDSALMPAGPLREPRTGNFTLVIQSATVLDGTVFAHQLNMVKGFADATQDKVEAVDGGASFKTTISFNINQDAFENRFPVGGAKVTK